MTGHRDLGADLQTPVRGLAITMRSDPRYLCGVRELVRSVAGRLGFDEKDASKMAMAVDEALANVICHGYGRRTDRPIYLRLDPLETDEGVIGLTIVIEDEADQVDIDAIKGRDLEQVRPGGLGVHIIHEIMDEVAYEPRDGGGMRLTMTKHRSSCGGPPGSEQTP